MRRSAVCIALSLLVVACDDEAGSNARHRNYELRAGATSSQMLDLFRGKQISVRPDGAASGYEFELFGCEGEWFGQRDGREFRGTYFVDEGAICTAPYGESRVCRHFVAGSDRELQLAEDEVGATVGSRRYIAYPSPRFPQCGAARVTGESLAELVRGGVFVFADGSEDGSERSEQYACRSDDWSVSSPRVGSLPGRYSIADGEVCIRTEDDGFCRRFYRDRGGRLYAAQSFGDYESGFGEVEVRTGRNACGREEE